MRPFIYTLLLGATAVVSTATLSPKAVDYLRELKIAAEHGNDLHRIFEDARSRQGVEGRRVVSFEVSPERESSIVREDPPV